MLAYSPQNIFATLDCYTPKKSSDTHGHRSITVKPDVLLMGTLQTSATTLVFRLTAWVEQVATCVSKLLSSFGTSWQELVENFQNVFQVLLKYFKDRFASFYVDEPLSNYQDLLGRVKKAVPFLQGVDDQQIVISYHIISSSNIYQYRKERESREYILFYKFTIVRGRNCLFLPTRLSRKIRPTMKEYVHNIGNRLRR